MALLSTLPEAAFLIGRQNQLLSPGFRHRLHRSPSAGSLSEKLRPGHKSTVSITSSPSFSRNLRVRRPVYLIGVPIVFSIIDIDEGGVPQQNASGHHLVRRTASKGNAEGLQLSEAVIRLLKPVKGGFRQHGSVPYHTHFQQNEGRQIRIFPACLFPLRAFSCILSPPVFCSSCRDITLYRNSRPAIISPFNPNKNTKSTGRTRVRNATALGTSF